MAIQADKLDLYEIQLGTRKHIFLLKSNSHFNLLIFHKGVTVADPKENKGNLLNVLFAKNHK